MILGGLQLDPVSDTALSDEDNSFSPNADFANGLKGRIEFKDVPPPFAGDPLVLDVANLTSRVSL